MGVKRGHDSIENSSEGTIITEDEAALYDRQIRLWGVNCQKRLRDAKILIIGLNGLGLEIVKNLTLSGVKSVTIMDETTVTESDYSAQYYVVSSEPGLTRAEASKAAIQELNPNVIITIDKESLEAKESSFFANFTVVFATGLAASQLVSLNKMCHEQDVLFFCGDTWGFFGYGFVDLLSHEFSKKIKTGDKEENVVKAFDYCTIDSSLKAKVGTGLGKKTNRIFFLLHTMNHFYETNKRWPSPSSRNTDLDLLKSSRDEVVKYLKCSAEKISDELLETVFGEISPVCAAVGGIVANEIIKGISKQGEPLCNFLFFDGEECTGSVEKIVASE